MLSLLAVFALVSRRSTEKNILKGIDSTTMMWMQQAAAMPFILATLFLARIYVPAELGHDFWFWMSIYVLLNSIIMYCYFKALSLTDISVVAPLLSLFAVTNIVAAYVILGQNISFFGIVGACLMVLGAFIITRGKKLSDSEKAVQKQAVYYALTSVVLLSIISNIEVFMLRESNPTSYNFYSSLFTILGAIVISYFIRIHQKNHPKKYWSVVKNNVQRNKLPLAIIGITYTLNMLATYQAKLLAPNAGYVGAVKQSQVVFLVLIGVFFFKENFSAKQWAGLILVVCGLVALATN